MIDIAVRSAWPNGEEKGETKEQVGQKENNEMILPSFLKWLSRNPSLPP